MYPTTVHRSFLTVQTSVKSPDERSDGYLSTPAATSGNPEDPPLFRPLYWELGQTSNIPILLVCPSSQYRVGGSRWSWCGSTCSRVAITLLVLPRDFTKVQPVRKLLCIDPLRPCIGNDQDGPPTDRHQPTPNEWSEPRPGTSPWKGQRLSLEFV